MFECEPVSPLVAVYSLGCFYMQLPSFDLCHVRMCCCMFYRQKRRDLRVSSRVNSTMRNIYEWNIFEWLYDCSWWLDIQCLERLLCLLSCVFNIVFLQQHVWWLFFISSHQAAQVTKAVASWNTLPARPVLVALPLLYSTLSIVFYWEDVSSFARISAKS